MLAAYDADIIDVVERCSFAREGEGRRAEGGVALLARPEIKASAA